MEPQTLDFTKRSVSGYTFLFCGAAVLWSAKKQPTIVLSSTKAKYMAMTHASKEVIFLNHLDGEVGIPHSVPIYLLVDNCHLPHRKFHLPCSVETYCCATSLDTWENRKGNPQTGLHPHSRSNHWYIHKALGFWEVCEVQEGIGFDISGCA